MSGFDERQDKFEAEYAHDAALQFKVEARRNRLLGEWAAEILGLPDDEVKEYAKSVVLSDMEEPGDEDVFRKVRKDLDSALENVPDETIRKKMVELMAIAKQQVQAGE